jgi:hypothetical protein
VTEAEWLTSEKPIAMGDFAATTARASDRVCRLYVAAFWGWQLLRLPAATRADLARRVAVEEHWAEAGQPPKGARRSRSDSSIFLNRDARRALHETVRAPHSSWKTGWEDAVRVQPLLLRDIFGNPFRPVAADPNWLTADVIALARGIYDDKAFDRMPILADALQDAGCVNEDVLSHCRTAQVHARGCWVVDLLLGKA